MQRIVCATLLVIACLGCTGPRKAEMRPLSAPVGTSAAISQRLEQGNRFLVQEDWVAARQMYLDTIQADPTLAEAHYNLALALERAGEKAEARKHYVAAANLAPGNKIIWDAPPLRKYDAELGLSRKSWMDANPK